MHDDTSLQFVVEPLLAAARARPGMPTVVEDVLACVYNLTLGVNMGPLLQVGARLAVTCVVGVRAGGGGLGGQG